MTDRKVARIFEEPDGKFYVCDDNAEVLDARGFGFVSKVEAMRAAKEMGFTHATGSGTYWKGVRKLPEELLCKSGGMVY